MLCLFEAAFCLRLGGEWIMMLTNYFKSLGKLFRNRQTFPIFQSLGGGESIIMKKNDFGFIAMVQFKKMK